MEDFNENVKQNEKEAGSTNKVPERAEPSGDWVKGNFISWCCPQEFCDRDEYIFAWCPKCYDEMEDKREGQSETNGGRRKISRAKESTTEVTHDLRGDYERRHTMEDMRYCFFVMRVQKT